MGLLLTQIESRRKNKDPLNAGSTPKCVEDQDKNEAQENKNFIKKDDIEVEVEVGSREEGNEYIWG